MASSSLSDHEDDRNGRRPSPQSAQRPPPSPHGGHAAHRIQLAQGSSLPSIEQEMQHILSAGSDRASSDHGGKSNLPSSLLEDIAHAIHNRRESVRLAVKLELDDNRVMRMLDEDFTADMSFRVLHEWVDRWRHRATGAVLYRVLHEIDRPDIADSFVDELIGEDIFCEDEIDVTTSQQTEYNAGATNISQLSPSLDVLQEIARYIPKRKHCVRLAERLELEEDFVRQVEGGGFADDVVALKVLCKWRQSKLVAVTGRALYDALTETLKDAVCFAEMLLGEDNEDWEEVGYDDSHRDFFWLMKQRDIDILASYERMRCSEEFLHVLHVRHVVSAPEYEDLLECSRALPRPAMNRKLLDLVNRKPKQLQEIFCELLCSYQHHLVILERGTLQGSSEVVCGDVIVQSDVAGNDLLADVQEQLKRWFKQLILTKPLDFSVSQDVEPVDNVYVTLSSISYDEAAGMISGQRQMRNSELIKAATKVHAESEHSKEMTDLHSLLSFSKDVCAKSALLFGEAGSGKSLSALKILSEWSREESTSPFKQFDLIVYVTGRERARLQAVEVRNFWQLWKYGYTEHQQEYILNYYARHSEKVLFLIDAWDESGSEGILQEDTVIRHILRKKMFCHSSVIITSRPAPNAYPLLKECHRRYTLVGFKNKRLRELFVRRLGEEGASQLFTLLSQSSHVHVKSAVQKTPLFASMLVQLYRMKVNVPTTVTAIYQALLESLRLRYLQWFDKVHNDGQSDLPSSSRTLLKADFEQADTLLSELALTGLMNNKMSFTKEEVRSYGRAVTELRFGLLSEVKEFGVHGSHVVYFFSHLTWQEFMAARCLAIDPNFIAKLKISVHSIGIGRHTHLFWKFLAGLIDSHFLPCLVFELASASGLSGVAPWETEIRLFLIDCVAESMRMRHICGEDFSSDQYVDTAATIITSCKHGLNLTGCILDSSHLLSVAVLLEVCPWMAGFTVSHSRIDAKCPALSDTLCHVEEIDLSYLVGQGVSSLVVNVCDSVSRCHVVQTAKFQNLAATADCLRAVTNLINNSKSLRTLVLSNCSIGIEGIAYLHGTIRHSSAVQDVFCRENFAGCGGYVGQICARLSQLQCLNVSECSLNDNDFAMLLAGLQSSCKLERVHASNNLLTDAVAFPLMEYAVHRQKRALEVRASLAEPLPELLIIFLTGNNLSEQTLAWLAYQLPISCGLAIRIHGLWIASNIIKEVDYVQSIRTRLASSDSGQLCFVDCPVSDSQAVTIARVIAEDNSKFLTSLLLSQCEITDGRAAAIASVLPLNKLQAVDLSNNKITFMGFQILLSASASSSLQYLNVGQNPIFGLPCLPEQSQEARTSILSLSMSIHHLRVVSVAATQFSDELTSFENSPIALLAIPSLSALDLSNNEITDRSVPMVKQWMDKVGFLNLSGNQISSDGAREVIQKAESLVENDDKQQPPALRLQRIWLGGNCINRSILDECNCDLISGDSYSIMYVTPSYALQFFSEQFNAVNDAQRKQPHVALSGHLIHSPFWVDMVRLLTSGTFRKCMNRFLSKRDVTNYNYWITTACQILAFIDNDSHDAVNQERALIQIFACLAKWYKENRQNKSMYLVIMCCLVCVSDELVTNKRLPPSQSEAEELMGMLTEAAAQDDDLLILVVETLSSLAERYRRKQMYSVAAKLVKRVENLHHFL